jgi:hypothetical protein
MGGESPLPIPVLKPLELAKKLRSVMGEHFDPTQSGIPNMDPLFHRLEIRPVPSSVLGVEIDPVSGKCIMERSPLPALKLVPEPFSESARIPDFNLTEQIAKQDRRVSGNGLFQDPGLTEREFPPPIRADPVTSLEDHARDPVGLVGHHPIEALEPIRGK